MGILEYEGVHNADSCTSQSKALGGKPIECEGVRNGWVEVVTVDVIDEVGKVAAIDIGALRSWKAGLSCCQRSEGAQCCEDCDDSGGVHG